MDVVLICVILYFGIMAAVTIAVVLFFVNEVLES